MVYMGGKARLAKIYLPIILKDRNNRKYYEPFAGGMNMIANVDGNRYANDNNKYLIAMWKKICDGWIPDEISKDEYYNVKENKDKYPLYYVGWVGVNCSYSGKWFGGYVGLTKLKNGNFRNYQREAIKNVLKQVPKLQDVIFSDLHYLDFEIDDNSIVYCDPPYANTTKYHIDFDTVTFWNYVRDLSKKCAVYISEYTAPDDFVSVCSTERTSTLSGYNKRSVEQLYTIKE